MNFRIVLLLFILLSIITFVESKEYSCKWKDKNGIPYSMNYSTEVSFSEYVGNKCEWLKKYSTNEYDKCINDCKEVKKIFKKGGCKEINYE